MGSMNINFGSGKGTIYSNQNSENSLFSLLNGGQGNNNSNSFKVSGTNQKNSGINLGSSNPLCQKNSYFGAGPSGNGLFSGINRTKNSSIVNSINQRTYGLSSVSTLKEQNPALWAFLHPAEARAEGIGESSEIELLEESLKENGLGYDYKKVSKEIKSSKDSGSATKAVSTARKTLSDLKKKIRESANDENIDPYEVQAALVHAEKMVHIAEKHLKNVKQEEIAERNQKGGEFIDLGIKDNLSSMQDSVLSPEEEKKAEESEDEDIREDVRAFMESVGYSFDDDGNITRTASGLRLDASIFGGSSDFKLDASDLLEETVSSDDEISALMEDLSISDGELPDFLDDMTTPNLYGMEPNEVKMLKLKHRLKESIAIAKADAEYLKVVFDRINEMKSGAGSGFGGAASPGGGALGDIGSSFDAVSLPTGEIISSGGPAAPVNIEEGSVSGIDFSV